MFTYKLIRRLNDGIHIDKDVLVYPVPSKAVWNDAVKHYKSNCRSIRVRRTRKENLFL